MNNGQLIHGVAEIEMLARRSELRIDSPRKEKKVPR